MRFDVYLVLAAQAFQGDRDVLFARTLQEQFVRHVGARQAQRRVFVDDPSQHLRDFSFVDTLFRANRDGENRLALRNAWEQNAFPVRCKGRSGGDGFKSSDRHDRTRAGLGDRLLLLAL